MRAAAVVMAAGIMFAGLVFPVAPTASAELSAPPEQPNAAGVDFKDNPSIAGSEQIPIQSWSRVSGDRAVAVHFPAGTPACNAVHATTTETADAVTIDLEGGSLPTVAGRICTMVAVTGTLVLPLKSPLGNRRVLSAA
jgi:hypothetical protein